MTFDPDFLGCSSSTDRPFELVNNDINERSNEGGESDERRRSPLTVQKEVSQTRRGPTVDVRGGDAIGSGAVIQFWKNKEGKLLASEHMT